MALKMVAKIPNQKNEREFYLFLDQIRRMLSDQWALRWDLIDPEGVNETIDDRVATLLTAGNAITITYDDEAATLTVAVSNEVIQDMIAAFLTAGAGITLTYLDASNSIEISVKRQSYEAPATSVSGLTLNPGASSVDIAAFNTALSALVTEINAVKTKLNNVIAKLIAAQILSGS